MSKIYYQLAVVGASVALSFSTIGVRPALASIIKYDFTVSMTSGSEAGNKYFGYLTYDDSLLEPPSFPSGKPVHKIGTEQSLNVFLNYQGTLYKHDETTPIFSYPNFPVFSYPNFQLEDGSPSGEMFGGLFWIVFPSTTTSFQFSGNFFGWKDILLDPNSAMGGQFESEGFVTYSESKSETPTAVSEPSSVFSLLAFTAVGACLTLNRKRASS